MILGLTPQQAKARAFIAAYQQANGFAPSFDEIAAGVGLRAKSGVQRLVSGLEKRGAVRRAHGSRARNIELVKDGEGARPVHG